MSTVAATPTYYCYSKNPVKAMPSSDKKFKSDEFIESSNEDEDEGENHVIPFSMVSPTF